MIENARRNLESRPDLRAIYEIVTPGSKILDLGCGDGSLLYLLRKEKNVFGCGVEISQEKILDCNSTGVPVVHGNLNDGLGEFPDKSFSYVVLSQTLQAVQRPDLLLKEMVRVGENVIISFINFGHYCSRFQLLFSGKMPVNDTLPTPWYETQNIHLATIKDFRELCARMNIEIKTEIPLDTTAGNLLAKFWPNMFSTNCVFLVKEKEAYGK